MKPLINESSLMIVTLGSVTSLCVLLAGCSLAAPHVPNPNFVYWCLGSAGFLIVAVVYLIVKLQKYQELCNKFIED
ncbi:MAG: hypothetical protein GY928_31195 [Colwellia sp.]|nr:hypothetical protein [Colwellia sp.]